MEYNNSASESEQMYLLTIARLSEMEGECPIPVSKVAEVLEITPISANQMIHHLEEKELVTYTPYKGVEFTESGWKTARQLLRIRRLWEVFLAEHLNYAPTEAETLACRLEHAVPSETASRLGEYLGNPSVSPQGKPIPSEELDAAPQQVGVSLGDASVGNKFAIIALPEDQTRRTFLQQAGFGIGQIIELLGKHENGTCLIENDSQQGLSVNSTLAEEITVAAETNSI